MDAQGQQPEEEIDLWKLENQSNPYYIYIGNIIVVVSNQNREIYIAKMDKRHR
jgi:hypothetical protein